MTPKKRFVALAFAGAALLSGFFFAAAALAADDSITGLKISPVLNRTGLALGSVSPLFIDGQVCGSIAVYDDTTTPRPADYLEFYDNGGRPLALAWFDRFGIERTAVDRGLLQDADNLEGVFVVLPDGDSI